MKLQLLIIAAVSAVISLSTAHAQQTYSLGHGDIRIAYTNGQMTLAYSLDAGSRINSTPTFSAGTDDLVYGLDELVTFVPDITVARPPGTEFDFLGVAEGEPLWYIPEVQEYDRPWLGTSSETLVYEDWTNLTIRLVSMEAPAGAHVSLFDSAIFDGSFPPKFVTVDGITEADTFVSNVDSHAHYNWMFTKPGTYKLTLLVTGHHLADGVKTATGTLTFRVGQGKPAVMIATGQTIPLDSGDIRLTRVGTPANDDWYSFPRLAVEVSFTGSGVTPANDSGILFQDTAGLTTVLRVREGDPVSEDGATTFASFGEPALDDNGTIYYTARLRGGITGSNNEVLARTDYDGATTLLAREGDDAPGLANYRLGRVNWFIAAPNGVVHFCASAMRRHGNKNDKKDDETRTGVWRVIGTGAPKLLVATGQRLETQSANKTVTLISRPSLFGSSAFQSRAASPNAALALRLTYKSGDTEIVRFASPLP